MNKIATALKANSRKICEKWRVLSKTPQKPRDDAPATLLITAPTALRLTGAYSQQCSGKHAKGLKNRISAAEPPVKRDRAFTVCDARRTPDARNRTG
jgi:hypothetical protein